jgi:hypothetical protein
MEGTTNAQSLLQEEQVRVSGMAGFYRAQGLFLHFSQLNKLFIQLPGLWLIEWISVKSHLT